MTEVLATPIGQLLDQCKHWPLLSAAEELELARRIERGDLAAKERLINSNIRLVVSMSSRYVGLGLAQEDVIQEGTIGLMRAAEKFDWRRGFRFSTYASAWIRQSIQRALDHTSRAVRLPIHLSQLARKLAGVRGRLTAELGHEPSDEEIAAAAGVELELVRSVAQLDRPTVSLDAAAGPDATVCLGDLVAAPEPEAEAEAEAGDPEQIARILERLPPLERVVVALRYGHNDRGQAHTRLEASEASGLSRRRIERLERQALQRMAGDRDLLALIEAA